MKRATMVRHVPYEGLAGFRAPVEAAGYEIERIDVTDPAFADADFLAPDLLVLMGGPVGVYEVAENPWITGEVSRLAQRIERGLPTLGVCLGAQMIAAAMGARVYAGPANEVGFAPITLRPAAADTPMRHLADLPLLHWHGDTFDLPENVELLASTALYPHQIFRRGREILALQCHPEMGEDPAIERWMAGADDYMAMAGTDAAQIRADYAAKGPRAVTAGRAMLTEWLAAL